MRSDISYAGTVNERAIRAFRHPTASPGEVLAGTAVDGQDLTPHVDTLSQGDDGASVGLRWNTELYGVSQPRVGDVIAIYDREFLLYQGIVEAIPRFYEERGDRNMTLTVRTRDRLPFWKDARRVSKIYPVGTDVAAIARDIARDQLALSAIEFNLPNTGLLSKFSDVQLADLSAIDMLEYLYQPISAEPYVAATGQLKVISRDTSSAPVRTLTEEELQSVSYGRTASRLTAQRVKYLDPALTEVNQQDQVLADATITAGFFKLTQDQRVYWSDDRRSRAKNTYLSIKQSVNSGLLPVGDESYVQESPTGGRITVKTRKWVPGLATASVAAMLSASHIPDKIVGIGAGATIPVGRPIQAAAEASLFVTVMSLGTGIYEVRGTPYDFVNLRHTIEVYDENAPAWLEKTEEIENDLIGSRETAEALAINEMRYAAAAADTATLEIVDDPRLERGDVIELHDGRRFYIQGYQRPLTRNTQAILSLSGFFV